MVKKRWANAEVELPAHEQKMPQPECPEECGNCGSTTMCPGEPPADSPLQDDDKSMLTISRKQGETIDYVIIIQQKARLTLFEMRL